MKLSGFLKNKIKIIILTIISIIGLLGLYFSFSNIDITTFTLNIYFYVKTAVFVILTIVGIIGLFLI